MLSILFTCEYELFANGRGDPRRHMVQPTERLMSLLDDYGARLTIHADCAQIMRFRDHRRETGRDEHHYGEILDQLRRAVGGGHDVQLHLHPSYCDAHYAGGRWQQDDSRVNLARLPYEHQVALLMQAKAFLEGELRPVRPDYRCIAFRGPNWCVQPSGAILRALVATGFIIDTSVWKHGVVQRPLPFDYRAAHSDLIPWPVAEDEVCEADPGGRLFEVPIYCERRTLPHFFSVHRVWRALDRLVNPIWRPPLPDDPGAPAAGAHRSALARLRRLLLAPFRRYPLKMDFNQCTGRQLLAGLRRAEARYGRLEMDLPFVIFGHSRTFNRANAASLRPFLREAAARGDRYRFARFGDLDLERYRPFAAAPVLAGPAEKGGDAIARSAERPA